MEKNVQGKVIKYLKKQKCYIIKTTPGMGVPVGCPDIIFLKEGFWGAIECKANAKSKFQSLQPETIEKLNEWSWCKSVHSENLDEILAELDKIL